MKIQEEIISKLNRVQKNQITDYELVEECERILEIYYSDQDTEFFDLNDIEREVLEDISAQWDLMIVNTFDEEELPNLNLKKIKFPNDYIKNWLTKLF